MDKNDEPKVRVKITTEGIVGHLAFDECIDVANKIDDIVFNAVLTYVTNSVDGGYATDEDFKEYLNGHKFELLRAIYSRGDI